jgi:hypothetical protein
MSFSMILLYNTCVIRCSWGLASVDQRDGKMERWRDDDRRKGGRDGIRWGRRK